MAPGSEPQPSNHRVAVSGLAVLVLGCHEHYVRAVLRVHEEPRHSLDFESLFQKPGTKVCHLCIIQHSPDLFSSLCQHPLPCFQILWLICQYLDSHFWLKFKTPSPSSQIHICLFTALLPLLLNQRSVLTLTGQYKSFFFCLF